MNFKMRQSIQCALIAIILCCFNFMHAQEFNAAFFQVHFIDGEGTDNPKYIYTETSAILELVAKGKATIVLLGEKTMDETTKDVEISKDVLVPGQQITALQGLKWGVTLAIDHITAIAPKGALPSKKWEVKFTCTANLFPTNCDILHLNDGQIAVKEMDALKMSKISGGTITSSSRLDPILFVLPVGRKSIVVLRMEPVEK